MDTRASGADKRFVVSLLIVLGIAITQSGSTQFSKSAQNDFEDSVNSPLFMTWSGTVYNVLLALPAVAPCCAASGATAQAAPCERPRCGASSSSSSSSSDAALLWGGRRQGSALGRVGFLARVLVFYVLWTVANYSYQRSLKYVPASLAASLFACCPALVALGSVALLGRRLPALGWLAVASTVAGSVFVVEPWQEGAGDGSHSLALGLMMAFVAAVSAAMYKVLFKLVFDEPPPVVVGVILAWIGVFSATLGSAVLTVVLRSGLESVRWSDVPWTTLLAGNISALGFNFLIGWGIAVSDPLFVSLGSVLAVPANIAVDLIWRSTLPTAMQGVGIGFIVGGFLLLTLCDLHERRARQEAAATSDGADGGPLNTATIALSDRAL